MKKMFLSVLLGIILLILVGCGHSHEYIEEIIDPTCTKSGYTKHICSCGDVYYDRETGLLEHNFGEWKVLINPTEEKEGLMEKKCKSCELIERESIPKLEKENYVERLNSLEYKLYTVIIKNITLFNNPKSVKLIEVFSHYWNGEMMVVKINAENYLGAMITNDYVLITENLTLSEERYDEVDIAPGNIAAGALGFELREGKFYSITELGDPRGTGWENYDWEADFYGGGMYASYLLMMDIVNNSPSSENKISVSIFNINNALEEYKNQMGW